MYNDNINFQNLKKVSNFNPLFNKSYKAYHELSQSIRKQHNFQVKQKNHFSYIVIDSVEKINQQIFQCKSLCPVFIVQNESYILVKGDNLWDYYRSKKQHEIILTQQQLCVLLKQIIQALIKLEQFGYNHHHIKQYAIFRNSEYSYQLVYHPSIKSMLQLAHSNKYYWYDFYLSPQQLKNNQINKNNYTQKDTVFSLGLLILNVMNPEDFNRDVYSKKKYQIDWDILNWKINNSKNKYSNKLIKLVENCLKEYSVQRYGFKQVYEEIKIILQQKKYSNINFHNKISQLIRSKSRSKSKSKNSSNKSSPKNSNSKEKIEQLKQVTKIIQTKCTKQMPLQNVKKWNQHSTQKKQIKKVEVQLPKSHKIDFINEKQEVDQINFQRGTFGGDIKQLINHQKKKNKQYQQLQYTQKNKLDFNPKQKYSHCKQQTKQNLQNQDKIILPSFGNGSQQEKNHQIDNKLNLNNKFTQNELNNMNIIEFKEENFNKMNKEIKKIKTQIERKQKQIKLTLNQCLQPLDKLQKIVADQSPGIFVQGDIYFGNFRNGRRNGLGLQLFPEGQYYFGNFKDDLFHGEGFYFWNKHQYFLGIFQNGKKKSGNLRGSKINYTGQFNGQKKMNGIGKTIYKTGQIYIGQWKNGKRDGIGQTIEALGDKFTGIWQKGKKKGIGQYTTNNFPAEGYKIKAYWMNQQITSNVIIEYSNENVYQGTLKDFQKHGKGQYKFKKGGWFKGTFYEDEATHGQLMYKNGQKYIGCLKNMKRHGYGQYYYLDGAIKKGNWIEDVRVEKNIQKESK